MSSLKKPNCVVEFYLEECGLRNCFFFRTIRELYPHFWTVPASGHAEPSHGLLRRENSSAFVHYIFFIHHTL